MFVPIKGFENYAVSDTGEVMRLETMSFSKKKKTYHKIPSRVLKGTLYGRGYPRVSLCIKGKPYEKYIHRLVAEAFIPNPNNLPTVNHKDGNKLNNCVDNLEWCTYSENNQHAYDMELKGRGSKQYKAILSEDDVYTIKDLYFNKGVPRPQIYKMYPQVHRAAIHNILAGHSWKHIKI